MKYFESFITTIRLCRCRELPLKSMIFTKINNYLNRALNIEEIEQRYMELEMLKLLMLDEHQLRAFQSISFLKSVEDITKHQYFVRQDDSDDVDPKLEKALQLLFSRNNVLDQKLNKYFE